MTEIPSLVKYSMNVAKCRRHFHEFTNDVSHTHISNVINLMLLIIKTDNSTLKSWFNPHQSKHPYCAALWTSLPKVISEEGRVAALSHTYAVKSTLVTMVRPKFALKNTPPHGPIHKPASSLDLSDLWCQMASGSDPLFFHNALDRPTDRQMVHGKVWWL